MSNFPSLKKKKIDLTPQWVPKKSSSFSHQKKTHEWVPKKIASSKNWSPENSDLVLNNNHLHFSYPHSQGKSLTFRAHTHTQQCDPPWGFSSFESATSGSSWWWFKLCRSEPSSAVSEAWQQGLRLEKATIQSNVAKKRRIQAFLEEHAISQKPMEERCESWVSEKTKRVKNFRCEGSSRNAAAAQRRSGTTREERERRKRRQGNRTNRFYRCYLSLFF